jgi:hypothetical protein
MTALYHKLDCERPAVTLAHAEAELWTRPPEPQAALVFMATMESLVLAMTGARRGEGIAG